MKAVVLALTLLSFTAFAQDVAQPRSENGRTKTVRGCLSKSGDHYYLGSNRANLYQLTGDTSSFDAQVGKRVEVTGTLTRNDNQQTAAENPNAVSRALSTAPPTIQVRNIKEVEATCGQ